MGKIRIAIAGIGNCASALLQGIEFYKHKDSTDAIGFMHWDIGGYRPGDIEVVAAFDIDKERSERMLPKLFFSPPIARKIFLEIFRIWMSW